MIEIDTVNKSVKFEIGKLRGLITLTTDGNEEDRRDVCTNNWTIEYGLIYVRRWVDASFAWTARPTTAKEEAYLKSLPFGIAEGEEAIKAFKAATA